MPIIPLTCPNCGGNLKVDSEKDAAICEYCKKPYIVKDAVFQSYVNNYTTIENLHADVVNVTQGPSADNLKKRAQEYFISGAWDKAAEYYNRVLDFDADDEEANRRLRIIAKDSGYNSICTMILGEMSIEGVRIASVDGRHGGALYGYRSSTNNAGGLIATKLITLRSPGPDEYTIEGITEKELENHYEGDLSWLSGVHLRKYDYPRSNICGAQIDKTRKEWLNGWVCACWRDFNCEEGDVLCSHYGFKQQLKFYEKQIDSDQEYSSPRCDLIELQYCIDYINDMMENIGVTGEVTKIPVYRTVKKQDWFKFYDVEILDYYGLHVKLNQK